MPRKPHEPSEKTRGQVSALAGFGARDEDIASYLGITRPTLYKYYSEELKKGSIVANVEIAKTLYNIAKDGNASACMFWLKTRAGWRETNRLEVAGDEQNPLQVQHSYDLSKLSEEKLLQLKEILLEANTNENPDNTGN